MFEDAGQGVTVAVAVLIVTVAGLGAAVAAGLSSLHQINSAESDSDAYGCTWSYLTAAQPNSAGTKGIWGFSNADVWITDGYDGLAPQTTTLYHFDGAALTSAFTTHKNGARGIFGTSPTYIFATGGIYPDAGSTSGGSLLFDGTTWTEKDIELGDNIQYRGVWGDASNHIWAAGSGGSGGVFNQRFRLWDGTAWNRVSVTESADIFSMHGTSANNVWVSGSGGYVARWDGTSWNANSISTAATLTGIWTNGASDTWTLGTTGGVATAYHWDGSAWTSFALAANAATASSPGKVFGNSGTDVFMGGEAIYHWNGATLSQVQNNNVVNGHTIATQGIWTTTGTTFVAANTFPADPTPLAVIEKGTCGSGFNSASAIMTPAMLWLTAVAVAGLVGFIGARFRAAGQD